MFKRAGTILFALMAAALGGVALFDVYSNGEFTLIDPRMLGALAIIGTGILLFGVITMHDRAEYLEGRTDRLTTLTSELESFIEALEAANKRLHASEARYKGLVNSQGDVILRRTPDGRVTYANEAFTKMFGIRADKVVGRTFRLESHPDSPKPPRGEAARADRVSYDQRVKTVWGYRWIAWEDSSVRDISRRVVEIQSVGRDISERKSLEAALVEARDRAQSANRAKSHFLATISHEIRTPMNGVLGMARLLLETDLAPDQKSYADAIKQSGHALLNLIEDILDFSKIESGTFALDKDSFELRPLIEGVAELLSPRAHSKKIELATAISAAVPKSIQGDAGRVRQVLTNLIGNAIKFTETGGVLVQAALDEADQNLLRVTVRDTGIGVPKEKHARIFEEFVQADSSHGRRFEGSGLGLTISKRLIQAMGGDIGINDGETGGSVFWITLPLVEPSASPSALPLDGKRIAIVSQSEILLTGVRVQLEASGAEIIEARSTQEAYGSNADAMLIDAAWAEAAQIPEIAHDGQAAYLLLPTGHRTTAAALCMKGYAGYLTKPLRQASLETRILNSETEEERVRKPSTRERRIRTHDSSGLNILLAEDNPVNALLARELLRRRGHSVEHVTTGTDAVTACANASYDLVIMDLHMPGLDGIEATRQIRVAERENAVPPIPIFALTADALETGRKACQDAGMNGFLTKPLDPAALDTVLEAVSKSRAAA